MRKSMRTIGAALAAAILAGLAGASAQPASPVDAGAQPGDVTHYTPQLPPFTDWSWRGVFGTFDRAQLRRGFQVYKNVCANCHSLDLVAVRTLADPGGPEFSEDEVKGLAAAFQVTDGPNDQGQMFRRPGRPSDHFPGPFANIELAKLANNGAVPPDLSLIAKARAANRGFPFFILDAIATYQEAGPDYIHALLTGYEEAPAGHEPPPGTFYNPYFLSAPSLSMPPQGTLSDRAVAYTDGAPQTVDQYSRDVAAFLMWTAEPKLVDRRKLGLEVLIFLGAFALLMYFSKKAIWARLGAGHAG